MHHGFLYDQVKLYLPLTAALKYTVCHANCSYPRCRSAPWLPAIRIHIPPYRRLLRVKVNTARHALLPKYRWLQHMAAALAKAQRRAT
jgi:hypothetical protein